MTPILTSVLQNDARPVVAAAGRNKYEEYNAYLDKLAADRKAAAGINVRPLAVMKDRPPGGCGGGGDAPGVYDPAAAAMRGQQAGCVYCTNS